MTGPVEFTGLETTRVEITPQGVAWVVLARPHAANARNQQMRDELSRIWTAVAANPDVKVVVLTAQGDRHFCAGMDLKEAGQPEGVLARRERLRSSTDVEQLAGLPQPTIAAINGAAMGGGLELALACDLRIMAVEARVGLPEVRHGLMPGRGGTQRLPRLVGLSRALELLYLGDTIDAETAVATGLVNQHVPRSELTRTAEDLADRIAQQPAAALRAIKESVLAGLELPLSAALERELDNLLFLMAERESTVGQE